MFKVVDADIIKPDGMVFGPYRCVFAGDTVIVRDKTAIINQGDQISRKLPNGTDEVRLINAVQFYDQGQMHGPHFQLDVKTIPAQSAFNSPTQHIHIAGGNVQIGNNNTMEFKSSVQYLIDTIESSKSSPEEKAKAKSLLKTFLEHPLVSALAGSAASAFLS